MDNRIPLNYRGISLICTTAKLYSSVLNTRIESFCTSENKIADEQNRFRKKRSCEDHIFVLDSIVRNRLRENLPTFATFVDFSKAFDCVNRDVLLHKLLNTGIDGKMYFTIKSLYSVTESCVKLGKNLLTDWFETCFGVRQGDCLSPTLFSIYLNDFTEEIKNLNKGVYLNADCISILLYADDIVLIAPSEEDMQSMLDVLTKWSEKWRIFVNKKKTKAMHFRNSTTPQSEYQFLCCNSPVGYVSSYKYLGVTMSEHLMYKENAEVLSQASGRALGSIIAKYKMQKFMGYKTYTKLFESCVCPVMDYGAGVWGFEEYAAAKAVQHRAMRVFLGVHRYAPILAMEGDIGWLSPKHRRWVSMLRLWNRLVAMDPSRLTYKVFTHDFYMAQSDIKNWCYNIWKILASIGLEDCFYNREPCDIDTCKEQLFELQKSKWEEDVLKKPKLRFYRLFKKGVQLENYVQYNMSSAERSYTAQLRFGILPLHIETGRFRAIDPENRLCSVCDTQQVEDEIHFLFHCPLYNQQRVLWLNKLKSEVVDFDTLELPTKLSLLFQKFYRSTSKFILQCFNARKRKLYNV